MSVTNSGKGLYWIKSETLDIKLTEMATETTFMGKKERNIGKKKFTHFITVDGENKVFPCDGGKLNCQYCRKGDKPSMKFSTVVDCDGVNYYSDFPVTLSRLLADAQALLGDMGLSEEKVLATVYTITRMDGKPYWEVRVKKTMKQVNLPVMTAPVNTNVNDIRNGMGLPPIMIDTPNDISELDEVTAPVTMLNDADLVLLRKYEPTIVKNLSKQENWDMKGALNNALKNNGWTADKISTAYKFFDSKGNFVLRSDLVKNG